MVLCLHNSLMPRQQNRQEKEHEHEGYVSNLLIIRLCQRPSLTTDWTEN